MFGKGDLKYVFLDLLTESPRHGYDLIRALEERFEGRYSASPGTVYPILQMLEDMGYVSVTQQDGRKVYTVTDAGHAFLKERETTVKDIWTRARGFCGMTGGGGWFEVMGEMRDLAVLLRGGHGLSDDQARRVRDALARTRREIEEILRS